MEYKILQLILDQGIEELPEYVKEKENELMDVLEMESRTFDENEQISNKFNSFCNAYELYCFRKGFLAATEIIREIQ